MNRDQILFFLHQFQRDHRLSTLDIRRNYVGSGRKGRAALKTLRWLRNTKHPSLSPAETSSCPLYWPGFSTGLIKHCFLPMLMWGWKYCFQEDRHCLNTVVASFRAESPPGCLTLNSCELEKAWAVFLSEDSAPCGLFQVPPIFHMRMLTILLPFSFYPFCRMPPCTVVRSNPPSPNINENQTTQLEIKFVFIWTEVDHLEIFQFI